jgi:hypothetical protein
MPEMRCYPRLGACCLGGDRCFDRRPLATPKVTGVEGPAQEQEAAMRFLERQLHTVADLIGDHAPSAAISIVIAELFYKFHSFTLECLTFLATWYAVDQLVAIPYRAVRRRIGGSQN